MRTSVRGSVTTLLLLALMPGAGFAQQQPAGQQPARPGIGVVTALQGEAVVGRAALPQPARLRFKDDVYFRDVISTREKATVRLLLGGKGTLTIREQSQVTLDEAVAPDGARQSVLGLMSGKIAAAVSRVLMRPGETVEIRTPNAVAAVRGTVLIAEYIPPATSAEGPKPVLLASTDAAQFMAQAVGAPGAGQSNFLVLQGNVVVSVQGQPPVALGPMQTVSVRVAPGGAAPQVGPVQTVTPQQATQATQGLQTQKQHTGEADTKKTAETQTQQATTVATAIVAAVTGEPAPTTTATQSQEQSAGATEGSTTSSTTDQSLTAATQGTVLGTTSSLTGDTTGVTGVLPGTTTGTTTNSTVADITPPAVATVNTLPAGTLIALAGSTSVASGVSLATFNVGGVNTVVPTSAGSSVTAPLVEATGTTLTHAGPVVQVGTGGALSAAGTTPLVQITGVTLANSGSVIGVSGGQLSSGGPAVGVNGGGLSGDGLLALDANSSASFSGGSATTGSILQATTAQIGISGSAVSILNSPTSLRSTASGAPMLSLSGGALTLTGGSATTGALLTIGSSSVMSTGPLLLTSGTTVSGAATNGPWVRLLSSSAAAPYPSMLTVTGGRSLFTFTAGSTITAAGTMLYSSNGIIDLDAPVFDFQGASTFTFSGGPAIVLNGGSLIATGGIGRSDESGNQIKVNGALLDATNASVVLRARTTPETTGSADRVLLDPGAGSYQIRLVNSSYTDLDPTGSVVDLPEYGTSTAPVTYAGLLLRSDNSTISIPGSVTATGYRGRLLDLCCAGVVQTTGTSPLFYFTRSVSSSTEDAKTYADLLGIFGQTLTTAGPLLQAAGTSGAPVRLSSTAGSMLAMGQGMKNGVTSSAVLTSTASGALIDLSTVEVSTPAPTIYVGMGSQLSLAGSLLKATNTTFGSGSSTFLFSMEGSRLTSTTTKALLSVEGGSLAVGSGAPAALGVRTGSVLSLAGGLLETTGTSVTSYGSYGILAVNDSALTMGGSGSLLKFDGGAAASPPSLSAPLVSVNTATSPNAAAPNLNLTGTGNLAQVDYMLMAASAPIVQALNGAIGVSGDPANLLKGAMAFGNQSQATAAGAVWLNNSFLTVNNGPLLSAIGGAQVTFNGDFASLIGGSKLTVQNGPLIYVDGTGSRVNITGGLIAFSGTGNQVIVNNSLTPTQAVCGIPVQQPTVGSVTIPGQYPIKGSGAGTVTLNGVAVTNTGVALTAPTGFSGSLIRVTNGGTVNVNAAAP